MIDVEAIVVLHQCYSSKDSYTDIIICPATSIRTRLLFAARELMVQ